MDGIVTDLVHKWIAEINKKFHQTLTVEDMDDWDMVACKKVQSFSHKVHKIIQKPMFFWDLSPIPGSIAAVKKLHELHDVKFLTAAAGPTSAMEKLLWIDKYFPFVGHGNVIMTKHKELVRGDVFFDDKGSMIEKYKKTWPEALVMSIEYPYNKQYTANKDLVFVGKYTEYEKCWENAIKVIQEKSEEQGALYASKNLY